MGTERVELALPSLCDPGMETSPSAVPLRMITIRGVNAPGTTCRSDAKEGARIRVNPTIVPGVTIGEYALVGSGSVVTRDVSPHTTPCGNPARVLKMT